MNRLEQYLHRIDEVTLIPLPKEKNEDWYKLREGTLGGSDVSVLFGENKYKHERSLFAEKTGKIKPERFSNPYTYLGTAMEGSIFDLWKYYNPKSKSISEMHDNKEI